MSDSHLNLSFAFDKHPTRWIAVALVAGLLIVLGGLRWLAVDSRDIDFLARRAPAEWIVFPAPADGFAHQFTSLEARFRRTFFVPAGNGPASLSIRGFRQWSVLLNDQPVMAFPDPGKSWKEVSTVDVTRQLQPGTNVIDVTIANSNGLPALWLAIEGEGPVLVSDTNWDVSLVGAAWQKAATASAPVQMLPGNPLQGAEHPAAAFIQSLPTLALFAVLATVICVLGWRRLAPGESSDPAQSSRWSKANMAVVAVPALLWLALFCNNLGVLPYVSGFDSVHHLDYIDQVRSHGHLPLAGEGFQTYQPPLYYLVSALWLRLFNPADPMGQAAEIVRVLGLGIGIGHFILVFLCLRLLFPGRPGPQFAGLLVAAFVPEQLYISQYVTNEGLSAALVTAAFYFCLRILREDRDAPWLFVAVGVCMGAALLTKVTGAIAIPVLFAALAGRFLSKREFSSRVWAGTLGLSAVAGLLVCGWHYLRVWLHFGKLFVGNWDPAGGLSWWMERGYATGSYFFRPGGFLNYPWFSGFNSFAGGLYSTLWGDGLWGGETKLIYRPPWNYELMAAGYLLALLPTALILAGLAAAVWRFVRRPALPWFLMLGTAFAAVAALIYMALKVPTYGEVKSFYALIALLPLCAFAAAGWEILQRAGRGAAIATAVVLGVWAMTSFGSFWIERWNPVTLAAAGRAFEDIGERDAARPYYAEALRRDPQNVEAAKGLARFFVADKQFNDARERVDAVLKEAPDDAEAHSILASILAGQGQAALAELAKSVSLAPGFIDNYVLYNEILVKLGHSAEATIEGRSGLRCNPLSPEMHYDIGIAFANVGDNSEALTHFRLAVELKPDWLEAQEQLGLSLLTARQPAAALPFFEAVVEHRPDDEKFRYNLALALNSTGDASGAIREYRQALALKPDYPEALNNLAWMLATDGDPQLRSGTEAVQLAARACELTKRKQPVFVATLAAGYAETGRFAEAISTTMEAADIAKTAGDTNFVSTCDKLLQIYHSDRAYHQPARPATP